MRRELSFAIRFIKAYFKKGRFVPRAIPRLSIETTNMCDAQCVFCANKFMRRPRQHLDMDLFRKIVDDFVSMQGKIIDFNVIIGEPLLDPHLLERARYVRQFSQSESLGFVTNLQWLHKFDIDEFYAAGFNWLAISTVLSGREKYRAFFGVDRYEQVIKNILRLLEENKRRKNKILLVFSVKPTDEPISAVINHPDFQKINSLSDWDLTEQFKNQAFLSHDWTGLVKLPPYLKRRPIYPRLFRPCRLLYDGMTVFSNGNIGACSCVDFEANSELILGNIETMSLKEAWNSRKLFDLRFAWLKINKIPQICKRCTHYLY
jgi:radical SAM protein with 4Fe4S-binding SPASM domain